MIANDNYVGSQCQIPIHDMERAIGQASWWTQVRELGFSTPSAGSATVYDQDFIAAEKRSGIITNWQLQ
jgi:hypothetical protein